MSGSSRISFMVVWGVMLAAEAGTARTPSISTEAAIRFQSIFISPFSEQPSLSFFGKEVY